MGGRLLVGVVLISVSSAIAIGACGGTTADTGSGGADSGSSEDATIQDTGVAETGDGNDSGVTDSGTPSICIGLDAGCFACCAAEDPDAAAALARSAITCACDTPGDCKTDCDNTLCKAGTPKSPDAKCLKCIADPDAGGCIQAAETAACGTDATCKALVTCFTQCKN